MWVRRMVWTRRPERERAYQKLVSLLEELREQVRRGKPIDEAHRELEALLSAQGELLTEGSRNGSRWFLDDVARGFGDEQRLDLILQHADEFASLASRVRKRWLTERRRWSRRFVFWLGLATASALIGFAAVEQFGISNLGPGYWRTEPLPLTAIGYMVIGVPVGLTLVLASFLGMWILLIALMIVARVFSAPRALRSYLNSRGPRGIAGEGLQLVSAGVALVTFFFTARWISPSLEYWLISLLTFGPVLLLGGLIGWIAMAIPTALLYITKRVFSTPTFDDLLEGRERAWNRLVALSGGLVVWQWLARSELEAVRPEGVSHAGTYLLLAATAGSLLWLWDSARRFRRRHRLLSKRERTPVWAASLESVPSEPEEPSWSPQAVFGWRTWWWDSKARLLVGMQQRWTDRTLHASCPDQRCTTPPGWDCNCGVYAAKRPQQVYEREQDAWGRRDLRQQLLGTVSMIGRVIEHEDGYRAGSARIEKLWILKGHSGYGTSLASALYDRYPEVTVAIVDRDALDGVLDFSPDWSQVLDDAPIIEAIEGPNSDPGR